MFMKLELSTELNCIFRTFVCCGCEQYFEMPSSKIAHSAQAGFAPAKAYDAHRPSYPEEAVEQFLQKLEVAGVKAAKVADLAAGTGKFTEILARRPENYDIVAIEPHDGMRGELDGKTLPRVSVVKGTADSMSEIPDESLACVIAAQAFHWFANMGALKEIARVLQPTGVLGGIWNIEDCKGLALNGDSTVL